MAGKSLTESQMIGRQGEAAVMALLTRMGFVCIPTGSADFGEDIICDIFQDGIRTNLSFRVQVKSSNGFRSTSQVKAGKRGLSVQVSTDLLDEWRSANYPVVLICWDISNNKGYWCAPVDQKPRNLKRKPKITTLSINYSQEINAAARHEVVSYVEKFFSNRLNINSSCYECSVYPVIMPDYKLVLSTYEHPKFIDFDLIESEQSEYIPSFLGSYTSLNSSPFTNKIKFSYESPSLETFITHLKIYIAHIANQFTKAKDKWISFVVSPISISNDGMYLRNNDFHMTEWISFSFLNKEIVSDWDYTFKLSDKFIPTHMERASSVDENFFVHYSGKFAVEIKSFTKSNSIYLNASAIQRSIRNKYFILWDIGGVSEKDFFELDNWANQNGLVIQKINTENSRDAIIRDPMFCHGDFGTLTPRISTWDQYDSFDVTKLISTIPHGKALSASRSKKYSGLIGEPTNLDDIVFINYESEMYGLSLIHDKRIINIVICFEPKIDENSLFFKNQVKLLIKKAKNISMKVNYYTTRGIPDNFLFTAFECHPHINNNTDIFCGTLENDVAAFSDAINLHFVGKEKTSTYIRYHCGRYFDLESLIP